MYLLSSLFHRPRTLLQSPTHSNQSRRTSQSNQIRSLRMGTLAFQVPTPPSPLSMIYSFRRKTTVLFQDYKNKLIAYLQTQPMRMSWTAFSPGIFLDYYSPSSTGLAGKDKLASSETLWPAGFTFIVDFDKKITEVPGDGDTGLIAFTAADDIGGFIAAACTQLSLAQWPTGEWGFCGGLYTPNEVVRVAETIRGSKLGRIW